MRTCRRRRRKEREREVTGEKDAVERKKEFSLWFPRVGSNFRRQETQGERRREAEGKKEKEREREDEQEKKNCK